MTSDTVSSFRPELFTDEWVNWLDVTLSKCSVGESDDLVLQYRVTNDDGSLFSWHVSIENGRISACSAQADETAAAPHVTLTSDRDTARAIAVEGGSAQRAFAEGRLHLSGDPLLLLQARHALEAVGKALRQP